MKLERLCSHFYSENENADEAIKNLRDVSFLLGLLWLLVLLLDDPGVDGLGVVGHYLADQALSQKLPQGLSRKRTANLNEKVKPYRSC